MSVERAVSYDPYDVAINADPYPVFRRLREEAPLYYNDQHDFYALSRYDDCERGLVNFETFPSGRGGILELIKGGIEMPPGTLIFEDLSTHPSGPASSMGGQGRKSRDDHQRASGVAAGAHGTIGPVHDPGRPGSMAAGCPAHREGGPR